MTTTVPLVEFLESYKMQVSGGLTLNHLALKELKWEAGKVQCEQYLDTKLNRVLISGAKDLGFGTLPELEIRNLFPLFRIWPITEKNFVIIDERARTKLGWKPGMLFKQTLDRRVPGIWIEPFNDERSNQ